MSLVSLLGVHGSLIVSCVAALVLIVVLISWARLPPFLSILGGAVLAGLGGGLPMSEIMDDFSHGAGDLLGHAGLIIALGAMLGAILTKSGAADRIAETILGRVKPSSLPWAMALVAVIVGLPLFFEVGLVLLVPLMFVMMQRSKQPLILIAVPTLAGMTTLHALLPPHPGPLIAVSALHADLGLTMLLGAVVALPTVIIAGPLYAYWLSPRLQIEPPESVMNSFQHDEDESGKPPGTALALFVILLPALLMLGHTAAKMWMTSGSTLYRMFTFFGEPLTALAITVVFAVITLGWMQGHARPEMGKLLRGSLRPIAGLLLTIGAGGGLKEILLHAGIGRLVDGMAQHTYMPIPVVAWLIAMILRQATGSATVATATTAGILAPSAIGLGEAHGALLALAVGSGSVFFSHVNDAGFWMVREYFGLSLKQTLIMWSLLQSLVSVVGLCVVLGLWAVI